MAFDIHNISTIAPEDYPFYFCDANVWISTLNYFCNGCTDTHEEPYQTFVEAIINLNEETDPKVIKRIKNKPKIYITPILISEIINAYMRNVAMKAYFGGDDTYKHKSFKRDYRDNQSSDYCTQLKNLCTDLKTFKDYTILLNIEYEALNPFDIIPTLPTLPTQQTDFNDYYYYKSLKGKGIPFVTNDKDFQYEDFMIITARPELLRLT